MLLALLGAKPVYVFGRRLHHGKFGKELAKLGVKAAAIGALLMLDDILDYKVWDHDWRRSVTR